MRKGFSEVWALLCASYPIAFRDVPSKTLDGTLIAYEAATNDIPDEQLKAAALQCITSCKWFPTIAELREAAFALANSGRPTAEEAWGIVKKLIRRYGSYGEFNPETKSYSLPKSGDELIDKTIAAMGWRELCMSENEVADRAHFFKVYNSMSDRANFDAKMIPEVRAIIGRLSESKRLALKAGRDDG